MILRNNLHACFIPSSKAHNESLKGQEKTKSDALCVLQKFMLFGKLRAVCLRVINYNVDVGFLVESDSKIMHEA